MAKSLKTKETLELIIVDLLRNGDPGKTIRVVRSLYQHKKYEVDSKEYEFDFAVEIILNQVFIHQLVTISRSIKQIKEEILTGLIPQTEAEEQLNEINENIFSLIKNVRIDYRLLIVSLAKVADSVDKVPYRLWDLDVFETLVPLSVPLNRRNSLLNQYEDLAHQAKYYIQLLSESVRPRPEFERRANAIKERYVEVFSALEKLIKKEITVVTYADLRIILENSIYPEDVGYFLWAFGTALHTIPDLVFEVERVEFGSWKIFGRFRFETPKASEETKKFLKETVREGKRLSEKAKDAGEAYAFDRHIEDVGKTSAEKEKIKAETAQIEQNTLSEEQAKEHQELDLEAKRLDIESKRLENEARSVELAMKKLEVLEKGAELAAQGLLKFDGAKVHINDILYIENKEGELIEVNDIDEIEPLPDSSEVGTEE